jgi:hypothetical protein
MPPKVANLFTVLPCAKTSVFEVWGKLWAVWEWRANRQFEQRRVYDVPVFLPMTVCVEGA